MSGLRPACALALVIGACSPRVESRPVAPNVGGDVVAVVGQTAVHRRDVERRARAHSIPPRSALRELEDEIVLSSEARRRGLTPGDLEHRREQVLAQLLLRSIERDHPASEVAEEAVARRLAGIEASLRRPARRVVAHLLVRADASDAAARAAARSIVRRAIELAAVESQGEATLERVAERLRTTFPDASIVVERIPAFSVDAAYDRAFVDAAFGRVTPGLVDHPVETGYGVHALDVLRAEPAYTPTHDEVRARGVESELEAERSRAVAELVAAASARFHVEVRSDVVRRRLGDDNLFRSLR